MHVTNRHVRGQDLSLSILSNIVTLRVGVRFNLIYFLSDLNNPSWLGEKSVRERLKKPYKYSP